MAIPVEDFSKAGCAPPSPSVRTSEQQIVWIPPMLGVRDGEGERMGGDLRHGTGEAGATPLCGTFCFKI